MELEVKVINTDKIIKVNYNEATFLDIAKRSGLGDTAFLALVGNQTIELNKLIKKSCEVEFLGLENSHGYEVYRRSTIFLMVKSFYDIIDINDEIDVFIDNSMANGFYCRVSNVDKLEDLYGFNLSTLIEKVDTRMRELVEEGAQFKKEFYHTEEAINLFSSYKMHNKERLFHYRRSNGLNIYSLHRYQDYYYGKMLPSTKYIKWFSLHELDSGFILQCPNRKMQLLEPQISMKLFSEYKRTYEWNHAQGIETVADLNDLICANDGRINELIQVQESYHDMQISVIADNIASNPNIKFVMIAGPSSSGKTTFSNKLKIQLLARKLQPHYLGLDNYYKERKDIDILEDGSKDFESLNAIDVELFNDHMKKLLSGEEVKLPKYNFAVGKKEYKGESVKLSDNHILVIEGIHGLNDKLSYSLPRENKYKIYISPLTQLNIDYHNRISTSDVRLLRRIARDVRTRDTDASTTIKMWKSVREGERLNIFPFQEEADIMFNSALVYELSILKTYVQPLLFGIKRTDPNYVEVKRLLKFLDYIVGIDSTRVPKGSLCREFIGGSFFDVG